MFFFLTFTFIFSYTTYGGNQHCNFRTSYVGKKSDWDIKLDVGTKGGATLIIEDDYFIVATYNFEKNEHYEYLIDPDTGKQVGLLTLTGKKVGVMVFNKTYVTFVQEQPTDRWSVVAYSLPNFELVWQLPLDDSYIPRDWMVDVGFTLSKNQRNQPIIAQFYNPETNEARYVSIPYGLNNMQYLFPHDKMMYTPTMLSLSNEGYVFVRNDSCKYLMKIDPLDGHIISQTYLPLFVNDNDTMGGVASSSDSSFYVPLRDSQVVKYDRLFNQRWIMPGFGYYVKCTNVAISDDEKRLYSACVNKDGQSSLNIIDTQNGRTDIFEIPDDKVYCAFNSYKNPKGVEYAYSNPGSVIMEDGSVFLQCDRKSYLFSEEGKLIKSEAYQKGYGDALLSAIADSSNCVYYCLNPPSLDLMMTCYKRCF